MSVGKYALYSVLSATLITTIFWSGQSRALTTSEPQVLSENLAASCDPGIDMSADDRQDLFERLNSTETGKATVEAFLKKYGSLSRLVLQWDLVSYSQIVYPNSGRSIASTSPVVKDTKKAVVCIHLTRKLPDIEHAADLTHELTHANLLDAATLSGKSDNVEAFIAARISGPGGEAEAFAAECKFKRQALGDWDALCSPFKHNSVEMDLKHISNALYDGTLSASLTGETYPVMLAKQYRTIAMKRMLKRDR